MLPGFRMESRELPSRGSSATESGRQTPRYGNGPPNEFPEMMLREMREWESQSSHPYTDATPITTSVIAITPRPRRPAVEIRDPHSPPVPPPRDLR